MFKAAALMTLHANVDMLSDLRERDLRRVAILVVTFCNPFAHFGDLNEIVSFF
jgi:hypothetical protein